MKVFMSWSGERSHLLANALHDWMPLVLHYVEAWLSQADIEAGQRWADQVAKELEASNFGILCITKENVASPWVLFEAGALAKSMQGSRVIPLLLDLEFSDITGPLAQFQAKKVDRTGVFEVIHSLNQLAQNPVPDDRVRQLFDALWPELEKKVAAIPQSTEPAKHARPQAEVMEELVASVRTLDGRFRELGEDSPRSYRSKYRRFHPMMLRDMRKMMGIKPGDPILLLVVASFFRDEIPWVYELGMDAYRMARDASAEEAATALRRFQRMVETMRHGPFGPDEMESELRMMIQMMVRELDHLFETESEASIDPESSGEKVSQTSIHRTRNSKPSS